MAEYESDSEEMALNVIIQHLNGLQQFQTTSLLLQMMVLDQKSFSVAEIACLMTC